jgi:hypothetical protein
MARWRRLLSAALAASAISCVATVPAEEGNQSDRAVSINEIPAPARTAILRRAGGGRLMRVQEETGKNGKPVYKGHFIDHAGVPLTMRVDAAGNVLSVSPGD